MGEEGRTDLAGVGRVRWRDAVETDGRVDLRQVHRREDGQGSAHAKAEHRHLGARFLQVGDRPLDVLGARLPPVEVGHQVVRLVAVRRDLAAVEVRDQRPIAGLR